MEVLIVAHNPDDKGAQLEKLTAAILKKLGYGNIAVNEIGSGGNEIDVTAEFNQPAISKQVKRLMICECKAHKAPITTSDWMKFLGKVFTYELGGKQVDGCFIALNGANGNVKGQYRALKEKRDNIHLVSGDELFEVFIELFGLLTIDQIQETINSSTQRPVLNTSICYFEHAMYWLITFTDNHYTLLTSNGKKLNKDESLALQKLINSNIDSLGYIDLHEENEARARAVLTEKFITSMFLLDGKKMNVNQLLVRCNAQHGRFPVHTFDKDEISAAIDRLVEKNIMIPVGKSYQLKLLSQTINALNVVEFYYHFFEEMIILIALGTPNYKKLINGDLLEAISEIQGKLPIPELQKNDWIKILQMSPSALGFAIVPDPFLLEHRKKFPADANLDAADIAYFNQKISLLFAKDFSNQQLVDYFYNTCDAVEMDTEQIMKIKGNDGIISQIDFKERLRLGVFSHENHEQVIAIRVLPDQKEPWEEPFKRDLKKKQISN